MELYFGEYQHVQQEYGVHLRLASDETKKLRNSQHPKAGSYGVSIRVQGIDGHPYIVLNNTERCLPGTPFSENGPFPPPVINDLPVHPSNGAGLEEDSADELPFPENPYAPPSSGRTPKQPPLFEAKHGALECKEGPGKPSQVLNFQRHPELLQPYDPEKNEVNLHNHQPAQGNWLQTLTDEGSNSKKGWTYFSKPSRSQPASPPLEELAKSNVTAIRLCSSVVIDDPKKQTSVCVNVQSCAKQGPAAAEAPSPGGRPPPALGPHPHSEAKKTRPDVLPFRRQDSAGAVLDGARSRRSSSTSTTPTSANSLYRFLLDDQECALHADNVNRHENRRYIPFLPGTGRDIDTGSMPGVDQLIEKFDQKPGLQRRGRSGRRNRIHPEDRKRSRSVDSAFPFGLQGNSEYLTEFSRNLGKSSEHLLRPSQVCPQRPQAPEHPRGRQSAGHASARPQGAPPRPPQPSRDGKALESKGGQESTPAPASSFPAQKKEEEIKTATATLMLQNRGRAASPDSGAKKISVKTFASTSNTQATPDLLKGQQELTQQTNEETAKQILYNYLKEGSTDNDDATKRKVNLVFEKIQTLKSRAAGSAQGSHQASNSSSEVKDLLEQKTKLTTEVAELQRQLQLEVKNQQNIKEERERMKANLEELQSQHDHKEKENSVLQRRLEESEGELRKSLEELFQVKMEREQHQTEIRDLQDQLSEMHDELDSAKRSEDREKGALIEELLQAKQDLQDLLIAKEEQEDLLRKRERELTALKGALKEEVSSHDQEMEKLKEQYDAELQALRESVEEATQNVEVLASRSASQQAQVDAELRVQALEEENERLRGSLGELEQSVARLQRQAADLQGDEAKAKDTLRKYEGEIRQLEEALVCARKEEKEATAAKRALQSELEEAQASLSRATQEQKQLSEKLREEAEQKEQLRRMKNEMENERWHLDKTIEKLQKEMADIVEVSRTSTLELQNQLDDYKEKNRRELAEMQRQLKEKTLEAEKSRLTASKMQEEKRLMEEELRDYQRAQDEALTKKQLLEQTLKDLEYELEAKSHLKDDRGRLVKQMEDKVSQLELELEEERNNSDLLSERITRSREQMEQMRNELLQERAVRQDLECDKISLERQNKDLKSRIMHLEGSYRSSKEGLVVQLCGGGGGRSERGFRQSSCGFGYEEREGLGLPSPVPGCSAPSAAGPPGVAAASVGTPPGRSPSRAGCNRASGRTMPKKLLLLPPLSVSSAFRAPRVSPAARLAMNAARTGYRVFSANSTAACTELAKRITERLGAELGKSVVYQETNGETRVEIKESVRGQDVFIIQTIPRDVNTAVMELLIMAYALKTACARNIIGVIPYFPYSKQSKMRKRGSIVCKLLASMLAKAGLTHIITMDLHQKEIQGFFSFPVDNLRASPFLLQYIQEEIPNYRNAVIVAKSPDAAKRAQSYAERLRLGLAVIHGEAQCTELDMDDGRHSPPMVKNATVHPGLELPLMMAKEKPPITVVGDVGGRIAIIVDDIIDDVESFVAAAEILKERGAYKIYVMATHGILSAEAPRLIEESSIDEVVVTNTVPHEVQKLQCPKIKTVDISLILSEAIRRIHNGESMAYLFRNITVDD